MPQLNATGPQTDTDALLAARLAVSATATGQEVMSDVEFFDWLDERRRRHGQEVRRTTFAELSGWHFASDTGDLEHRSGRFFAVRGMGVSSDFGPVPQWRQPIIRQPEIGILGIAVREINGVLHCLLQAKSEPGNVNGVQLSPTVQATKSNYTRVHGGSSVPYLDCFRDPQARGHRVLADALQSEQGSWFFRKRNRNMIVEVGAEVEAGEDFCWLTLRQVNALLHYENLINMDARTVLSCLPDWRRGSRPAVGVHSDVAIRSWITTQQSEREIAAALLPLREVEGHGWYLAEDRIFHEQGLYFSIVPVDVVNDRREVASWSQPLLEPHGTGVVAMLMGNIHGVPHCLVHARGEPGSVDVVELAATVQCTTENYAHLPAAGRPRFLDLVENARPEQILFDTVLSEEGGRFLHAQTRYLIIEADDDLPDEVPSDYMWVTLSQLGELLKYSHYLNVQARTLVAALRSVTETGTGLPVPVGAGVLRDGEERRADHR
ncbi:NDP-hexose 2,3-dehydratase family protein [Streptomyces graminilatus]|uniref:NDP-hexose 2,3-dehydratase family protein n=1 Tax=Streptomyces graminilatus TaxID=1464070 RepID=UPI0007C6DC0F|nr:NDP-hexose 2,3-dehydratase family protein [Streptomyces graminilatus]